MVYSPKLVRRVLAVYVLSACASACSGSGAKPGQQRNAPTGGAGTNTEPGNTGGSTDAGGTGGVPGGSSNQGSSGEAGFSGCTGACGGSAGAGGTVTCSPECDAGCVDSKCLVCVPNSSRCVGNAVATCSSDGTTEGSPIPCTGGACMSSGGEATCRTFACTPDQNFCDTAAALVMQCASDGFSSSVAEDCAASGKACVGAACVPVVCTPGQKFCEGNSVHVCNALGTASSIATACTATQHCSAASSPVACVSNICNPSAPVCDASKATTCNDDGSGYVPGSLDCTTTGQVCSAGTCVDPICTPGVKTCQNGAVVQCNSDALTTSVVATCTSSQYCDPATVSCQTKVCSPNQPVCVGSVLSTCDALGAALLPGGSECAPSYCYSGACTSALFFEDFEDGDYAGWAQPVSTDYTRTVVTNGADGTTHSLCMTHLGSDTHTGDGVWYTLPSIAPTYISWWALPQTKYSNFIEFYPTNASSGWMIWQLYDQSGNITLNRTSPPTDISVPHGLSWYHTEIKNLDWQQRTFDYYIDGKLIAAGVTLQYGGNQFGLLAYFHTGPGSVGCIDQILMK
jgi:hypothetical protein